jgi:hypothetical protein
MSLFGQNVARQTAPPTPDDTLMVDIRLFDDDGHWSPQKIIFSASVDQQRASSLRATLFGSFMRLHARFWAENYVKSHLVNAPESAAFLTHVRSSGAVSRQAFFGLVAQELLHRPAEVHAEGSRAATPDLGLLAAIPVFNNLHEVFHEYVKNMPWEAFGIDDFKKLTRSNALNLSALIRYLAPHPENDRLIDSMAQFTKNYHSWMKSVDDEHFKSSMLRDIYVPLQRAIDDYRLESQSAQNSTAQEFMNPPAALPVDLPAHEFIENEFNETRIKGKGYRLQQYVDLMDSCFIEYCKDGEDFFKRAALSVLEDLNEKIVHMQAKRWEWALSSLSDSQKAEINRQREQLQRELPGRIKALKERQEKSAPAVDASGNFFSENDLQRKDFFTQTDWKTFDQSRHLSRSDISLIGYQLNDIDPSAADRELVDAIGDLLDLAHRECDWAKAFYVEVSEFRSYRDAIQSMIMLPAMDLLKAIFERDQRKSDV